MPAGPKRHGNRFQTSAFALWLAAVLILVAVIAYGSVVAVFEI